MLFTLKNVRNIFIVLSMLWSASAVAQSANVAPSMPMACPSVSEGKPFAGALVTISPGLTSAAGRCYYFDGKKYTEYALEYRNKNTKPFTVMHQFPISQVDVNKFTTQWQRTSVTDYEFICGNVQDRGASLKKPQDCLLVFNGNGQVTPPATVSVKAKFMDPVSKDINSSLKLMVQCYDSSNQQIACNAFDQNIQIGLAQFFSDTPNQLALDKSVRSIVLALMGDRSISADKSCTGFQLNTAASSQPSLILNLRTEIDSEQITQVDNVKCATGQVS